MTIFSEPLGLHQGRKRKNNLGSLYILRETGVNLLFFGNWGGGIKVGEKGSMGVYGSSLGEGGGGAKGNFTPPLSSNNKWIRAQFIKT